MTSLITVLSEFHASHRFFTDKVGRGYMMVDYMEGKVIDPLDDSDLIERVIRVLDHFRTLTGDKPGSLSAKQWRIYVNGASALFAWHVSKGEKITVLSPPPPEPITGYGGADSEGALGGAVSRIEIAHPTVKGAKNSSYQTWPTDKTHTWIARFGMLHHKRQCWRTVKICSSVHSGWSCGGTPAAGTVLEPRENVARSNPGLGQPYNDDEMVPERERAKGRRLEA
ncbi:hypothetical protein AJ78_05061 [Emergomyces pasteurianus Ep9510]|uniref:Uncharacterized protein n=1 Tax=Emergomyces pasteurianus Ep9510 TaxID=1447872 RepID=A0A1J9PDK1_9EURO|nr:hypothetical protein AJ78_05061 [Emergomyces pasteurianus Ep9510]